MLRVYLAAQYERAAEMRGIRDQIEQSRDCVVTSRWISQHDGEQENALGMDELTERPDLGYKYARIDLKVQRR